MTLREWKLYEVSELLKNMANRLTLIKTFPNLYIGKSAAKFLQKKYFQKILEELGYLQMILSHFDKVNHI